MNSFKCPQSKVQSNNDQVYGQTFFFFWWSLRTNTFTWKLIKGLLAHFSTQLLQFREFCCSTILHANFENFVNKIIRWNIMQIQKFGGKKCNKILIKKYDMTANCNAYCWWATWLMIDKTPMPNLEINIPLNLVFYLYCWIDRLSNFCQVVVICEASESLNFWIKIL